MWTRSSKHENLLLKNRFTFGEAEKVWRNLLPPRKRVITQYNVKMWIKFFFLHFMVCSVDVIIIFNNIQIFVSHPKEYIDAINMLLWSGYECFV